MSRLNITIAIPAYNSERTIRESIESALAQEYPLKEILVVDDCSIDRTVEIAKSFPDVRVIKNEKNLGIGFNLVRCMNQAQGKFIVYLCADDLFTNSMVVSDIVRIFQTQSGIGVIGRHYYQFMNGHPGAVMVVRDQDILLSSINPSGMAFRVMQVSGACNDIFLEMPTIVAQYLERFQWTRLEYDTIAARLHPGGNTGTKESYYNASPIETLCRFFGKGFKYHMGLIQIKNRAPKLLWREICRTVQINKRNLLDPLFWFCAIIAVITPSCLLREFSNFYRHRISRHFCEIINRPSMGGSLA